ncbi:unnamed protein product [Polarella glacialis]|uniref:Uncharacterized protein n=1 Tax=Polarella glacialis TaxID=89957 RepID=A0A813H380_POLGL|nr:unnamed protein product [Polarella glacialis]
MAAMAWPEGLGALESPWLPEISAGRICFSLALLVVSAKARSEVASLNGPWQVLLSTLSVQLLAQPTDLRFDARRESCFQIGYGSLTLVCKHMCNLSRRYGF